MNKKYLAHLHIRRLSDRKIVRSIGLNNLAERRVEKVMRGIMIKMSDDFYIDDSEIEEARAEAEGE